MRNLCSPALIVERGSIIVIEIRGQKSAAEVMFITPHCNHGTLFCGDSRLPYTYLLIIDPRRGCAQYLVLILSVCLPCFLPLRATKEQNNDMKRFVAAMASFLKRQFSYNCCVKSYGLKINQANKLIFCKYAN